MVVCSYRKKKIPSEICLVFLCDSFVHLLLFRETFLHRYLKTCISTVFERTQTATRPLLEFLCPRILSCTLLLIAGFCNCLQQDWNKYGEPSCSRSVHAGSSPRRHCCCAAGSSSKRAIWMIIFRLPFQLQGSC